MVTEKEKESLNAALQAWKQLLGIQKIDIADYAPLKLAYVGDCVYEVCIRTVLVTRTSMQVDRLNREASFYAKAVTQSKLIVAIMDKLTEQEQAVYKRGRNAKSPTKAKNASVVEYRMATGFEAVIGYLYLTEQFDRLVEVVHLAFEAAGMYNGRHESYHEREK